MKVTNDRVLPQVATPTANNTETSCFAIRNSVDNNRYDDDK